jgi:hypothetical protein
MGLALTVEVEQEVDEDVERRKLLAIAGAIMFGAPVFGQPEPLAVRRVLIDPPRRIGMSDVRPRGIAHPKRTRAHAVPRVRGNVRAGVGTAADAMTTRLRSTERPTSSPGPPCR